MSFNLSIFLPLLYLLFGISLSRIPYDFKKPFSLVLTRLVIPFVIIYNIITIDSHLIIMMAGSIGIMSSLFMIAKRLRYNTIDQLCFFYLNVGWLGLPIATILYGEFAARLFIATYISSSIFGNSLGGILLSNRSSTQFANKKEVMHQLLKNPAVISIVIGCLCLPFRSLIEPFTTNIYQLMKILMSILGMSILGLWLGIHRITKTQIKSSVAPYIKRMLIIAIIISVVIGIMRVTTGKISANHVGALYFFALLPPAANIVVLETYYLKTGNSVIKIACETFLAIISICLVTLIQYSF